MTTADDAMRLQRFATAELDLTIDDALLRLLLNFLQRHEREHKQRLTRGYRTALGKKGDADRIREARNEAAALRNASMRLRDLLTADRSPSGMDWAFELRANCIVSSQQNPILGSELELAVWRQEVSRLLDAFADLAEMRTGYFNNDALPFEAELPKQVEAAFAQGLACLFVMAGGRLGNTGKAGFPAFLRMVWPLVPMMRGKRQAPKFADELSRMVAKPFKDQIEGTSAGGGYCHELAASRARYTLSVITGELG